MKKILIISTYYFPYVGGAEISVKEIFKRLAKKYDVELITSRISLKNKRIEIMDGIKVSRVGVGISFLDKLFFPINAFFMSVNRKYDVLFCVLENQSAIAGDLINIFNKKPIVLSVQSGDTEKYIKRKLGPFYFLYNLVYNKEFYYQVISKFLEKRCINHGIDKRRIVIIPNGVDIKSFTPKISREKYIQLRNKLNLRDEKVMITVSRLAYKNAVDDMIKSVQYLKQLNVKLLVCGTGEKEKELKNLAKELKLQDRIIFAGEISHKDLPDYIKISDVFIRPSLSEGFGNSFIEAMACGVPVIGTNVGGIPDFLKDKKTGLFCKVRDPKDISAKVSLLLKNKKLYDKISKNGKKLVKAYDWDVIASKHDMFFRSLL